MNRNAFLGWLMLASAAVALAAALPPNRFDPAYAEFLFVIGGVGIWRYSLGALHFARALWFLKLRYPALRKQAQALGPEGMPSRVYMLLTSFRIDPQTTGSVYRAAIEEAIRSGLPTTIVASIVEMADQRAISALWQNMAPPAQLNLKFVRIPGTGKRDGLAHGFRAISRDNPPADAIVAVIDGDTELQPGCVRRCAPFFKLLPRMGGLTTNEFCEVRGSSLMREWHRMRFAQRHIYMCSQALSQRVLTLTGRMSMFRISVCTSPTFIHDVEADALDHWRLGRFRFLTGDDKSSWFSLMRMGLDTFYVPDAHIRTVEHPPSPKFIEASRRLMFRWYGNSLRQNSRATSLGPSHLGWFTYYVLWDQRIAMWTCLLGLSTAFLASIKFGWVILAAFSLWIIATRTLLTLALKIGDHPISPAYPLLLYYNQVVGSLMKIYVFHRLDQQSWTRQNTTLQRDIGLIERTFNRWSSHVLHFCSFSIFAVLVMSLISKP